MSEVETEFLFEARIPLAPPLHVGQTPDGYRMIVNVAGGRFEGPRLRGEVVPMSGPIGRASGPTARGRSTSACASARTTARCCTSTGTG